MLRKIYRDYFMLELESASQHRLLGTQRAQVSNIKNIDLAPNDSFQLLLLQPPATENADNSLPTVPQDLETVAIPFGGKETTPAIDLDPSSVDQFDQGEVANVNVPKPSTDSVSIVDSGLEGGPLEAPPHFAENLQTSIDNAPLNVGFPSASATETHNTDSTESGRLDALRSDAIPELQNTILVAQRENPAKPSDVRQAPQDPSVAALPAESIRVSDLYRDAVPDTVLATQSNKKTVSLTAHAPAVSGIPNALQNIASPPHPQVAPVMIRPPGTPPEMTPLEVSENLKFRPTTDKTAVMPVNSASPKRSPYQVPSLQTTPTQLEWGIIFEQDNVQIDDRPLSRLAESAPRQALAMNASPPTAQVPSTQPDVRTIATQLGQHLATKDTNTTVIRLDPEELGHVKMTLRTSENGLMMTIIAEKPETSELMRRNINELADEFRSMGFETMDFQFGGQQSSAQHTAQNASGLESVLIDENGHEHADVVRHLDGKLDIRL